MEIDLKPSIVLTHPEGDVKNKKYKIEPPWPLCNTSYRHREITPI